MITRNFGNISAMPDLIISDIMMPVMDGVKLCKAIKQNIRTCHIPVYMLSAKADTKYQLEGLQVGADDYIPKPFSMPILKTKIQNVLRTRYRVFERYSNTTEVEPEKLANNTMIEVYYLWIKLFINDIIISQLRKSLFTLCKMDEYKF